MPCNPNEVKYLQIPYPHLAFMDCRNYLFLSFGNTTPLSSHWLSFYALSINRGLQTVVILLLTYFSKFMTWLQDSAQRRQKEMQKALNHTSPQRRSVPDTILTPPSSNRKPRILRWAEQSLSCIDSKFIGLATQLAMLLVFRSVLSYGTHLNIYRPKLVSWRKLIWITLDNLCYILVHAKWW